MALHVDTATIVTVAAASKTSMPTVRKYFREERVQPLCHQRITQSLATIGLSHLIRAPVALDHTPKTRA